MNNMSISNLPLLPEICGTIFISFILLKNRTLICTIISKSFILENRINTPLCLIILDHF